METKNKLRKVKIKTIYEKGRRKITGSRVNVILQIVFKITFICFTQL